MKIMKMIALLCIAALSVSVLSACTQQQGNVMQDGYYTAEHAAFDDHGWKEFLTICVRSGKIVTVEYNARNASGFIKSWDMSYMGQMNAVTGTYPNRYTRTYAADLIRTQQGDQIDALTGATHSYTSFKSLANAAIANAKAGDTALALVE